MIISNGSVRVAVECKATVQPTLSAGTYHAIDDIQPEAFYVAAPVDSGYFMKQDIEVVSIGELIVRVGDIMEPGSL